MDNNDTTGLRRWTWAALAVLAALLVFNQAQIVAMDTDMHGTSGGLLPLASASTGDLSDVDVTTIQSTAQGLDAIYELEGKSPQQAQALVLPSGTPSYGEAMGVSFDDPTGSLQAMARAYPALKQQVQQESPETYQRWLDMASKPRGVSCEYCCSIGAYAITSEGRDMCGCQHHPALQTVALWLMQNTEMNDAEILREVYKWKALFFPRDMAGLASQIAGGDESVLADLPGMVGGC